MFFSGTGTQAQTSLTTYHNNQARDGWNQTETILTTANVNQATFGKLFSNSVDGQVYAQPLYLPNITIGGGAHNVVFVVTEHDSAYAFDADTAAVTYWHVSFIGTNAGVTTTSVPSADVNNCSQITPELGITDTPVIDTATGTIYFVAMIKTASAAATNYYQQLHALDISTGAEKFSGPTTIQAVAPTNAAITFVARAHKERCALALSNGVVYTSFTSHCDFNNWGAYHGWVLGYNASNISQQLSVFNSAPTAGNTEASFWESGNGPSVDGAGNLYFLSSNGTFDQTAPVTNFGQCFLKLNTSGNAVTVLDYFSPMNEATLSAADQDIGSAGQCLLPASWGTAVHPTLMLGADNPGDLYVVDTANMGKFSTVANNIPQMVVSIGGRGFTSPTIYSNGVTNYVYWGMTAQPLKCFRFSNGQYVTPFASQSTATFGGQGCVPSVSSNGNTNGIVWALSSGTPVLLHAYDATNLATELYNSSQAAGNRDSAVGAVVKFAPPSVVNGKVFVPTANSIVVYGLLATPSPTPTGSFTYTPTRTNTPANTATRTPTATPSNSPTSSMTNTATRTPTNTATITAVATRTNTPTNSPTNSPTMSPSNTVTRTATQTSTNTPTLTRTNTPANTPTNSPTNSATSSPTNTPTRTATNTPTLSRTNTPVNSPTNTPTNSATSSPTNTATPTRTNTPVNTSINTATNTATPSLTSTATRTATQTPTNTSVNTATNTPTPTRSNTFINTPTNTPTNSATSSSTNTATATRTNTPVNTSVNTATNTSTPTLTNTATRTATQTASNTFANTATDTPVNTSTSTSTQTATASLTATVTKTATSSPTSTQSSTATNSSTASSTSTGTPPPTSTSTQTPSNSPTASATNSASSTPTLSSTITFTLTASLTPSRTPTQTPTFSPTVSPTLTFTLTPTNTSVNTPTLTPTRTLTPTPTITNTVTPTFTLSNIPTFTPSFTSTPTSTPTQTPSPIFSASFTTTPLNFPKPVFYPNPASGGSVTLLLNLDSISNVHYQVFTVSFRKVQDKTISDVPQGLNSLTIPLVDKTGDRLANGLYYVVVTANGKRWVLKLLVRE